VSFIFIVGCGRSEEPRESVVYNPVPSVSEYRQVLEKRIASSDGANINVRQEVNAFENASDAEKREMYNRAKNLAR
jgi:hypothetical protein